ncbi:hypothetical protein BVC80_1311g7 [Macleaya cordata]|uniref:Uncharacterized protein n=1 Tax=Macleaya cordata TaxID=56857 RepID=A0A200QZ11_MACCD|nr:hypothetical protein BVC80_1311g7 [Macleaya cordata]
MEEMKMFESAASSPIYWKLKRYWRRKRYERLYDVERNWDNNKKLKVVYLGGEKNKKRNWGLRIRVIPKLRVKILILSPMMKFLARIRDGYINMMLRLAGTSVGSSLNDITTSNAFLAKRIPRAREVVVNKTSSNTELDTKLILEIYKLLMVSRHEQLLEHHH